MGWAAAAYQYGILAAHWYWIGAIPAMLFLGIGDDAVLLHLQDPLGSRLPEVALRRRRARALGHLVRLHDRAHERHQYVLHGAGDEGGAGLGHHFSIWVSSLTVAIYVALGGLLSAIFNEVLQFVLIWLGALLIPILGLIEAGGWSGMVAADCHQRGPRRLHTHLWSTLGSFQDNPMGIHWTGIVLGLGFVISFGYWTTDFLVVQRVLAAQGSARRQDGPHHRRRLQDDGAVHRDPAGTAGLALLPEKLVGNRGRKPVRTATTKCCP
jgi:SSS family solute:Na+ symporter